MWYINYTDLEGKSRQIWKDNFPEIVDWLKGNPGFNITYGLVIGYSDV